MSPGLTIPFLGLGQVDMLEIWMLSINPVDVELAGIAMVLDDPGMLIDAMSIDDEDVDMDVDIDIDVSLGRMATDVVIDIPPPIYAELAP